MTENVFEYVTLMQISERLNLKMMCVFYWQTDLSKPSTKEIEPILKTYKTNCE